MKEKRVTLKDVANATKVSLGTVHRALTDKEGVSDQLKNEILQKARQMGYITNSVASSLKRKTIKIAVVFPGMTEENRYFYPYVWNGVREFAKEIRDFNFEMTEVVYYGSFSSQIQSLEEVYENYGSSLDGLITIAHGGNDIAKSINKFVSIGVSVVLVCDDSPVSNRLCCVRADDFTNGKLAAELLCHYIPQRSKIFVAAGDVDISSHSNSVRGFEQYMTDYSSDKEVIKYHNYEDQNELYSTVRDLILKYDDLNGLYSCNARNTITLCKVVMDLDRVGDIKIIGTDIFDESISLLKKGVVQTIIYKNPYEQAYIGFKTLFEYIFKNVKPLKSTIYVDSTLVLKSNVEFYT
ncbi:substrate-binding domain-containing protein [Cohnella hongkongensis]|uniref:Substrate-binding domain-containing protein n=1 Tax=Cohnella hongkongensis TaxID=178337 RepID=A0ABV9FIG0_9BACL